MKRVHIMRPDVITFCGVSWTERTTEMEASGDVWIQHHKAEGELKLIENWSGDKPCEKCLAAYRAEAQGKA